MNPLLLEIIRRKKIVLVLALSLLVVNGVLMAVIAVYQEPTLAAARSKWSELRNQVARASHANASELYRQGKEDLEKLTARIPPKREFARVLSDLLETASNCGVVTGAISYKPSPIKDEALLTYQLSVSVSGDYAAIKSYLYDLQHNPELIVIDGISLANNDLFVEHVVMDLSITVYLREGA
ncbi:MAG: type 4a pilus biogenesis protein PilO [Desulfuromonadales bacterium]